MHVHVCVYVTVFMEVNLRYHSSYSTFLRQGLLFIAIQQVSLALNLLRILLNLYSLQLTRLVFSVGIQTQLHTLNWQELYSLNHLPQGPNIYFQIDRGGEKKKSLKIKRCNIVSFFQMPPVNFSLYIHNY